MTVVPLSAGSTSARGSGRETCTATRHPSLRAASTVSPGSAGGARSSVHLEVAIPAYNEAARLPQTLQRTVHFLSQQPWSSRVVVVDNGSSDETADVVRAIAQSRDHAVAVHLIGCARPGKGAAVRRALLSSRSRYVGFFDADLATPIETLLPAMRHLERGAAAVIGSRRTPGAELVRAQPPVRRLGGAAFRLMARNLVTGVGDTQCGFKFFEREAVTHAFVACRSTGFAFDIELLRQLQRAGLEIVELPVAWSHADSSSFSPWRDGRASFAAILQMQRSPTGWMP